MRKRNLLIVGSLLIFGSWLSADQGSLVTLATPPGNRPPPNPILREARELDDSELDKFIRESLQKSGPSIFEQEEFLSEVRRRVNELKARKKVVSVVPAKGIQAEVKMEPSKEVPKPTPVRSIVLESSAPCSCQVQGAERSINLNQHGIDLPEMRRSLSRASVRGPMGADDEEEREMDDFDEDSPRPRPRPGRGRQNSDQQDPMMMLLLSQYMSSMQSLSSLGNRGNMMGSPMGSLSQINPTNSFSPMGLSNTMNSGGGMSMWQSPSAMALAAVSGGGMPNSMMPNSMMASPMIFGGGGGGGYGGNGYRPPGPLPSVGYSRYNTNSFVNPLWYSRTGTGYRR